MTVDIILLTMVGILLLTALVTVIYLIVRYKTNRHIVDLGGSDFCYKGVKSSYRAGAKVTLYFTLIATDTNYYFYLDGKPINYNYDENKGFAISFTMPDHDIKLDYRTVNTMTYVPTQP